MKRVVLTGNGLSVALNKGFSLENITKRFYERLRPEHKAFIEHHMERLDKRIYVQLDFEETIAAIEQTHDSLKNYFDFLNDDGNGEAYLNAYDLGRSEIEKHLNAVQNIVYEYTASILDLIDGHVHKEEIGNNLADFVNWLKATIDSSSEIDLFTLNFDLLLETILLTTVGKRGFIDFHSPGKVWELTGEKKFNFSPDLSKSLNYGNHNVRLHHLHGSLSSFKDIKEAKTFKITTEALRFNQIYNQIFKLNIVPSIITGGGKSLKIQQSPFNYYYEQFTERLTNPEQMCDELFIIGYSFRDDHINKAINKRLKAERTNNKELKLIICDYKSNQEDKKSFIDDLNIRLELGPRMKNKFVEEDPRIIFGGANAISSTIES